MVVDSNGAGGRNGSRPAPLRSRLGSRPRPGAPGKPAAPEFRWLHRFRAFAQAETCRSEIPWVVSYPDAPLRP